MIQRNDLPPLLTGMMATLVGVGLARFAYTPLIPILVLQGWFDASAAIYLGAANLLGYLLGALMAHRLSERFGARQLLAFCFISIALSFFASATPGSFAWFFFWRLLAGITGAILVVVGPSLALTRAPIARRPVVGPLVFCGIGLGALLSATLLPLLIQYDLMWSWLTLGVLSLLAGFICDQGLARLPPAATIAAANGTGGGAPVLSIAIILVMLAYAMDAAGFIPHTVFWVDYLAREQGQTSSAAAAQWAMFGAGAIIGPLAAGLLVSRLGWHRSLATGYLIKCLAIALPLFASGLLSNSVSSFLVGAMVPGLVALTSGRLAELGGPAEHKRLWGYATAAFAVLQAASGYAMSGLYALLGSYQPLFALGSALLGLGLLLIIFSGRFQPAASPRSL
ncbi:MFS transporter [Pseudomonas sp. G11-1]|uniref:Predicted arabinose efflux permease, MFS family n=1 Tax=Halopseudomonas bauzanensis TaxID=653930 RepID=A0A1H9QA42_9GAMM|nr:YbfB/YjiJ family MFS transporter [Halopseudomonas bauzanensis]MCO5785056.1 MFS transporter [Pseudomonas sp. G11-1]MCO5788841.1 MFS transporter [Pseudomonas sp. G11-2]TKA90759.1 YbfB/YjiJ family MFS transporter [Halopseudomonas bauzanensis]SER57416.1 Predicted arabinose efflux permease, MFS family [Halopseudomonas bauzanensis]SFL67837.1 Predicted arabinose efflux permease, MFS family [Halopseudomonas bauzanensis]